MSQSVSWFLVLGLGALTLFGRRWWPWLGHLPGDFTFQRGNLTVFVPLGTCVVISIFVSIIYALLGKR